MVEHTPKLLAVPPMPAVLPLGPRITDGKFVLILGAGISMGEPTCLPSGAELAKVVKSKLLGGSLEGIVRSLDDTDLLSMADAVETKSPIAFPVFIRTILDSANFRTAMPNYAHYAISLLMAEAGVSVLSTNWDTCIERATTTNSYIVACISRDDILNAGNSVLLVKLHGCATNQGSIRVSSKQIAEETWWVTGQVGAAIEAGFVAFLGIGEIAPYIKLSVQKVLGMSKELSNVLVVDPTLSGEWSSLLADADKNYISTTSEEFLDDILRMLTQTQLSRARALAQEVMNDSQPGINVLEATNAVIDFLHNYPAHYIWLWVRRGFFASGPNSSILDPEFAQFVLGLALIHYVSPFCHFEIIGDTASIRSKDFAIELAWAREPGTASTIRRRKLTSLRIDKKRNFLPQIQRYVVVEHGTVFKGPSAMKESVVDKLKPADLIIGSATVLVTWINLGDLIQTWDKDKICRRVGVGIHD
jgi:hypothetical protein